MPPAAPSLAAATVGPLPSVASAAELTPPLSKLNFLFAEHEVKSGALG